MADAFRALRDLLPPAAHGDRAGYEGGLMLRRAALILLCLLPARADRQADPSPSTRPSGYLANRRWGIVHRADCPHVAWMKAANRVGFQKLEAAVAEGYRPSKHCLRRAAAATRPGVAHD